MRSERYRYTFPDYFSGLLSCNTDGGSGAVLVDNKVHFASVSLRDDIGRFHGHKSGSV